MKAVVHLICSADQSDEPEFAFEILLAEEVQNNVALKSSDTKFPSLSSWLFDTMTTSLQMIQYSATAPLSAFAVDKRNGLRCLSHAFVHVAAGLSFALKASYTKFPSLSSWLFDTMTTSTAIPFPPLRWINAMDCVAFHMLLCLLQEG